MCAAGYQGRYSQGHLYNCARSQVGQMAAEAGAQVPSHGANNFYASLAPAALSPDGCRFGDSDGTHGGWAVHAAANALLWADLNDCIPNALLQGIAAMADFELIPDIPDEDCCVLDDEYLRAHAKMASLSPPKQVAGQTFDIPKGMKFSVTMLYDVFGLATFGMADVKSIKMFGGPEPRGNEVSNVLGEK